MELAGRLKAERERARLSQEDVAKRIFVSRQTMSNWETGKTYPDVQSLLLLGNLFGVYSAACICDYRVDMIKKEHDLVTYRDLVAFMDGDGVDEPVPLNETAFSRVHPKLSDIAKALVGAAVGLGVALAVDAVIALLRTTA